MAIYQVFRSCGGNNPNLGETPSNTALTFTYRVGGGGNSNVQAGELSVVNNPHL